nr:hypothetical protein [Tanacetum cinerariifolium]
MYIKEVSLVGLEPRKSGKLVFSGYNLSLNVVLGGRTTQIGNFVKAIMFVSGITESKKLQEEGITSVEAEIVFDNSDTSGRSAGIRRSHLVNVKRQGFLFPIPIPGSTKGFPSQFGVEDRFPVGDLVIVGGVGIL